MRMMGGEDMTAREYLLQLKLLAIKIDQLQEERSQLIASATMTSVSLNPDKVQTSQTGGKVSRAMDKYVDLEKSISRMIDRYVKLKHDIISEIQSLQDARYVELLYLRYVPNENHRVKRLEEIACIMRKPNGEPYSFDHIAHLHGEALQEFWKQHGNRNS